MMKKTVWTLSSKIKFMKSKIFLKPFLVVVAGLLLLSCSEDSWNEHYYAEVGEKSDLNMYAYLKSQADLSTFVAMIDQTGLNEILASSQTFTVWAPDNDALSGIDLTNVALVEKIVTNHITLFSIPTAGLVEKDVMMLNGKLLTLAKASGKFTLQGYDMVQANIAVRNGIVHKMNSYVPYIMNVWEYIQTADNLDSLRNYVNSLTTLEFDAELSYQDGILIDSVMTMKNKILTNLARIDNESYQYKALLPDNQAWKESFDKIYPHFAATEEDGGSEGQLHNTRWTLVKDLFFSLMEEDQVLDSDSVYSTSNTALSNPADLFANAVQYANSNGESFITSSLKFLPAETWFRPIKIEAEYSGYGRLPGNYKLSDRTSYGSGMDVSSNKYIYAEATSTLSFAKLFVNFPIPNTLKGKYNVFAVFVPSYISDTTNQKIYKLRFSMNFDYGTEIAPDRDSIWANTDLLPVSSYNSAGVFYTEAKTISKVKILENFEFAYSNLFNNSLRGSDYTTSDKIRVGLRIENAAGTTAADKLKYNRNISVDCIILEPVIE